MDQKEKVQNTATKGLDRKAHGLLKYAMEVSDYDGYARSHVHFINNSENLDDEERDVALKTIERIKDRVNKAIDEAIGILNIWYDHYISNVKNKIDPSDKNKYESRMNYIKMMLSGFKNGCNPHFVFYVTTSFEWILYAYNGRHFEVRPDVKLDKALDDFVINDVENFSQTFVNRTRLMTGIF
jgi:hypothetical protein